MSFVCTNGFLNRLQSNSPAVLKLDRRTFLKTLCKKYKLYVFSVFHTVYPVLQQDSYIYVPTYNFLSVNAVSLDKSKTLRFCEEFRGELSFLPDNEILALYKIEAFADNKRNADQNIIFVFHIVAKGENACYQHSPVFLLCFQEVFFSGP